MSNIKLLSTKLNINTIQNKTCIFKSQSNVGKLFFDNIWGTFFVHLVIYGCLAWVFFLEVDPLSQL